MFTYRQIRMIDLGISLAINSKYDREQGIDGKPTTPDEWNDIREILQADKGWGPCGCSVCKAHAVLLMDIEQNRSNPLVVCQCSSCRSHRKSKLEVDVDIPAKAPETTQPVKASKEVGCVCETCKLHRSNPGECGCDICVRHRSLWKQIMKAASSNAHALFYITASAMVAVLLLIAMFLLIGNPSPAPKPTAPKPEPTERDRFIIAALQENGELPEIIPAPKEFQPEEILAPLQEVFWYEGETYVILDSRPGAVPHEIIQCQAAWKAFYESYSSTESFATRITTLKSTKTGKIRVLALVRRID